MSEVSPAIKRLFSDTALHSNAIRMPIGAKAPNRMIGDASIAKRMARCIVPASLSGKLALPTCLAQPFE